MPSGSRHSNTQAAPHSAAVPRWELFRLLSEPSRLGVLALCAEEELAVGELAELTGAGQPSVSRQAGALREAGLLMARKQGARLLLRVDPRSREDSVVREALIAGRRLCEESGALARIPEVLEARAAATRDYFESHRPDTATVPGELPSYLSLLAPLMPRRALAVDVGCGGGMLVELLAPVFERVIAMDRSETQLGACRARIQHRGYDNVELLRDTLGGADAAARIDGQADAVFAARVLHHAPQPSIALQALVSYARPGGAVVILDYAAHEQERLQAEQADLWLGFEPTALEDMARSAGLEALHITSVPASWRGDGPDSRVPWLVLSGRRAGSDN